jgi:prepilin-type N-terminal cleavage/methylation domain-containing protein
MKATAAGRRGFTLVEMTCVMILLTVVFGFIIVLLRETLLLKFAHAESSQRRLAQSALADRFRADVARAEKTPRQWRYYKAGPHTLILENRDGSHILYLWQEDRLERRVFGDEKDSAQNMPVGGERVGVEFVRDGAAPRLVSLRLLTLRGESPLPGQTLTIAAALGGDWR